MKPCLTRIGESASSPAGPDTNPAPPESPQPFACKHHLQKKGLTSLDIVASVKASGNGDNWPPIGICITLFDHSPLLAMCALEDLAKVTEATAAVTVNITQSLSIH